MYVCWACGAAALLPMHWIQARLSVSHLAAQVGMFELQSACWFQAKTAQTRIASNLFFNGPRSGINFNDGFGGGNGAQL